MTTNKTYAYIRVSGKDQNEDRQLDALVSFHIPSCQTYMDKQSGKDFNRPAYMRLMKRLKHGDLLIIKSIDRLGRKWSVKTSNKGKPGHRRRPRTWCALGKPDKALPG